MTVSKTLGKYFLQQIFRTAPEVGTKSIGKQQRNTMRQLFFLGRLRKCLFKTDRANSCLILLLSTEHFHASSDRLNNLHLSVEGTTSTAARFVAPAILILQILICSEQLRFDCGPLPQSHNQTSCVKVHSSNALIFLAVPSTFKEYRSTVQGGLLSLQYHFRSFKEEKSVSHESHLSHP